MQTPKSDRKDLAAGELVSRLLTPSELEMVSGAGDKYCEHEQQANVFRQVCPK